MRSVRTVHAIDSHTEGMPTRVVVGGVGEIPGNTMAAKRRYFAANLDGLRKFLMYEPRGHAAMSGAILQPPVRDDADFGVIYIEVSGCLPMCGHGTMGVATVLVETGMVPVTEPVTTINLDTPAGLVRAHVQVQDGAARAVTLRSVPSFATALGQLLEVPRLGAVRYDMAYGGNFFAIVELAELGLPFDRAAQQQILQAGLAIMAQINATAEPVHPLNSSIRGCRHVQFLAPRSTPELSRHAMVIHPGWFDRSPCGTGTCARMAQLRARGELPLGAEFVNESFIGGHFVGRLVGETVVGDTPAVIPEITGRAWLTGTAQYLLDPRDIFPEGFLF